MKFPVQTTCRVGFSTALVGVLTLVGVKTCGHVPFLKGRLVLVCVAFVLLGLLLWVRGEWTNFTGATGKIGDHPLAVLNSLRYWGFMVVGAAILTFIFTPRTALPVVRPSTAVAKPVKPPPAIAKPVEPPSPAIAKPVESPLPAIVKPVESPSPAIANPVKPPQSYPLPGTDAPVAVVFPALKLQGLVCSGENSTAVINGRTLRVGKHIGEVKLVAVAPKAVTVELSGEQRELRLEE